MSALRRRVDKDTHVCVTTLSVRIASLVSSADFEVLVNLLLHAIRYIS